MHRARSRTPGWAAFDRMHVEKHENGAAFNHMHHEKHENRPFFDGMYQENHDNVPGDSAYPPLAMSNKGCSGLMESSDNIISKKSFARIQSTSNFSFSSVVRTSTSNKFPLTTGTKLGTLNINIDDNQHVITAKCNMNPVGMLKDVHGWADQYLIEDVLAAVNNDVEQAFLILKEMASSETKTSSNPSDGTDAFLNENNDFTKKDLPDNSHEGLIVKQFDIPTEPDWEDDDAYSIHRKEALKMMRAATQHSRVANNAYLRGDHLSAQRLSSRAREEWMAAEQLNAKAAKEILRIRNFDNDMWKLDLHGLHAAEAVQALKQHLQIIESNMVKTNHSSSPDESRNLQTIQSSPTSVPIGEIKASSNRKMIIAPKQRQTSLHVITGTGNHSKGQASLPSAIKSFLIDGGYYFDDERPGVISVRPLFRFR